MIDKALDETVRVFARVAFLNLAVDEVNVGTVAGVKVLVDGERRGRSPWESL
jgi:hypothetical protein